MQFRCQAQYHSDCAIPHPLHQHTFPTNTHTHTLVSHNSQQHVCPVTPPVNVKLLLLKLTPISPILPPVSPGSAVLIAYGFIPTLQPNGAAFARVYAVYGGVFILLSYAWGWAVDKERPDLGDWIGTALAVTGVALAWFWPRG